MTDNTPPEALRLANVCSNLTRYSMDPHLIAAELRRQHARIAELEAQLEAIRAGGVQALSAAPAGFVPVSAFDRLHAHAESLAARLLAAEQATPKAAPATQQAGELVSVPKTVFEKCEVALNRYSQAPTDYHNAVLRLRDSVRDLIAAAAPQQEAQEPIALLVRKNSWRAGQWEAAPPDSPHYGLTWANQRKYVYEAPQPAPAPLSDDAKDAARYRWLRATTNFATNSQGERIDVRNQPEKWDAAIDAALAAQEGKA